MDEGKEQRVVPSGKVYRQIFDAEVQLVKALEDTEEKLQLKAEQGGDAFGIGRKDGIPIIQRSREADTGMLTSRQKRWTESFPNESNVENPVLYKYYSEEVQDQLAVPESNKASSEVRGLPDVLEPSKVGSDIIERIAESRKLRHEAAVEDMHQELGVISSELEPRIMETGEDLISRLADNDAAIDCIMARIEHDQDLIAYDMSGLKSLWEEIAEQSVTRQHQIKELDSMLAQIETDRMEQVRSVFRAYATGLEQIAHFMPPDLQRLLDAESQLINQTVLSNRRAYADLYARLMMSDIEREKRLHTQWTKRVEDWKSLHIDKACDDFRSFMESSRITEPDNAQRVLLLMQKEQDVLNQRRLGLVTTLRDLKPPASTKTAVYQWNQQITDISKQIDELNQAYFNKLYGEYEAVCQTCLEEVDTIKNDLITRNVCTETKAQQVITDRCLPLVGQTQTAFEHKLEQMDKDLEEHNVQLLNHLKSLFKYCQGAAHVWDVHELGLARQERALQERLEECRRRHDNDNQDKEANLDITMDRMRQDASEHALKSSLTKSLDMLNKIKDGYNKFHADQAKITGTYPTMVQKELGKYDAAVCKFFTVNRTHPEDAAKEREAAQRLEVDEAEKAPSPSPRTGKPKAPGKKKARRAGSRSSSRASDSEEKPTSPLPLAVSEVLSTSKGTTFYVLTVAGEHGAPDDDPAATEQGHGEEEGEGQAFLTETPPVDERPAYIRNVDIPETVIVEVKKMIRLNFLDHLEDWYDQAQDRSQSVVSAKMEELNSELDLRMHLHQPRARRAELDVHNVRAAELVMHSERVQRHCKGVNQVLNDLKHRFQQMTQEHNKLADKFRTDIEALEVIFVNATKSSKLVSLSNQLQVEQDKYMEVIRASLRQFRQHLDDTLQMLRESNARFIKSFKVFSDGGNFCPEEIDEYRKKLEKMAQKIDSSEGFVMADLEGMESKRLDQAMKIAHEFEDRFKHHMVDLLFMEKIARWLTNTQVKIKAEVADSNTQAQTLTRCLDDLDRRIDACEKPNLDKEAVTPTQLNDSLKSIFEAFHERSRYLNCVSEVRMMRRPQSAMLQGNPALGARVAFTSESVPPISRPGKQPAEDPTVGVIKNILKTQKQRLRFGGEAEMDGDATAVLVAPTASQNQNNNNPPPPTTDARDKAKSRGSQRSDAEGKTKKNGSKPGTANGGTTAETPKRTTSGKSKGIDKKYYVFGEQAEEGELDHLLGRVKRVLREALDGLLSAAEMYYRQKGTRQVTRPQALQETFEQCADIVVAKLQSYFKQADEYHNQCLQELRGQVTRLEALVAHVPGCVVSEMVNTAIQAALTMRSQMDREFSRELTQWDDTKLEHQELLRPTLGHPAQAEALVELCEQEAQRRQEYLDGVNTHTQALHQVAMDQGHEFIERLARECEQLLLKYDNLLTVDDVEKGRVPPTKHATSELLRRRNAGQPLEDDDDKDRLPRGQSTWPGMPKNELVVNQPSPAPIEVEPAKVKRSKSKMKKEENKETASVTTAKTTLGHSATVVARDKAYQEYKRHFEETLESIGNQQENQLIAEQRWTDSWLTSVNKVKGLY